MIVFFTGYSTNLKKKKKNGLTNCCAVVLERDLFAEQFIRGKSNLTTD